MKKNNKILITGGYGFVGTHFHKLLLRKGYKNIYREKSTSYDLSKIQDVKKLFDKVKPDYVFHFAAKVGGILDNTLFPVDYYNKNILINLNIFECCKNFQVNKLINLGAGCGYPLNAKEPLREKNIWDGFPQSNSAPYSLAKKMLIIQSKSYKAQFNLDSITIIPSNIYGPYDNFNLRSSHVIPALVRKFYEAKTQNLNEIEIWGSGKAKRDFIHAEDLVYGIYLLSKNYNDQEPINFAFGKQTSIKSVVNELKKISGFKGKITWNLKYPEGQLSRQFSIKKMQKNLLNFNPKYNITNGLKNTYKWLSLNYDNPNTRL